MSLFQLKKNHIRSRLLETALLATVEEQNYLITKPVPVRDNLVIAEVSRISTASFLDFSDT